MTLVVTLETIHPTVTVDVVILTVHERALKVLLVRRSAEPFKDHWALPGGFVGLNETLDEATRRVLEDKTRVRDVYLEQLYTFGNPGRDPRTRVITVAYYAFIPCAELGLGVTDNAPDVGWFTVNGKARLAFDHEAIIQCAVQRIRNKLMYVPIAFRLLPREFTLTELQQTYEVLLGAALDKRNFRKKILGAGLLEPAHRMRTSGYHRPAALYRFTPPAGRD